jgi:hypothetical protein
MVNVVVDGKRLLPGLPGSRHLAGGAARVAGVGEDLRLSGAVALIPAQARLLPEAGLHMIFCLDRTRQN